MLLACLILVCPLLCGAAEAGHAAHREHAASGDGPTPAHCPEDSDDCICRGALQSTDVRVQASDTIGAFLPIQGLVGILDHALSHSLAHLTIDGRPAGLAGWGDAAAIRAVLQNFRC